MWTDCKYKIRTYCVKGSQVFGTVQKSGVFNRVIALCYLIMNLYALSEY